MPFLAAALAASIAVALEVLAIGEQDKHPVVVAVLIEQPPGLLDRACQIGALARE